MWLSFVVFMKALPELVGLFKDLVASVKALQLAYEQAQTEKWINEGRAIAKQIAMASTDAERAALVKKLSDNWNNMR